MTKWGQTAVAQLLIAITLAGCAGGYQRVSDESEFRNKVVDRSLSWPGGFNVRFTADGRIIGQFPDGPVSGNWSWRNGLFCRSISIDTNRRPDECLGIELEPGKIRFRRADGRYFLPYYIGAKPAS